MPTCHHCQKHYHASLNLCPHCLSPRTQQTSQTLPPNKTMTPALALAIFLFPVIFSWFTLQKGYSDLSKTLAMSWLGVLLFSLLLNLAVVNAAIKPTTSSMQQYHSHILTQNKPTKDHSSIQKQLKNS
ncbi:hypothetical protein [uncultured Shewanella sp.]|uniref:hypothetical protein n=1 Tax=uncultured Shewanella sp. TaxID=173975 RepID=UPI00262CBD18|nr:hypothetical protein [uncultured Shewanella sp.]